MTSTEAIARDGDEILRCPACGSDGLDRTSETDLSCGNCSAQYPIDDEKGVCSLLPPSSDTAIKADIRKWWGDLFRQLYADHEATLNSTTIDPALRELEDLFRQRDHLAVNEMPLADLTGKTVLEIGAGAGAHSALFQLHGASVVAVDITMERVCSTAHKLRLANRGGGRAYQADAENLPFRDASFDIVYSNGVLHHSEDTDKCIDEVYRVLKPGGTAVIMLYAKGSATFWFNILPRALLSGEVFRYPEAQWVGRATEGKPKFGETKNPITRVYYRAGLGKLFCRFTNLCCRKSSFQFDNFCIPRLTQSRNALFRALGRQPHPGGRLVYGEPFYVETGLERLLGRWFGFAWNIAAQKPGTGD